jgi:hypothetical protein
MIQLASAPDADKAFRPAVQAEEKAAGRESQEAPRSRSGHAWPFLSRYAARPQQDNPNKPTGSASGS